MRTPGITRFMFAGESQGNTLEAFTYITGLLVDVPTMWMAMG
jgi:hypothetical protein